MIEKCDHPQFNSTRVAAFLALAQMQSEPFPNESPVPFETGPSLDGSGFATRFSSEPPCCDDVDGLTSN